MARILFVLFALVGLVVLSPVLSVVLAGVFAACMVFLAVLTALAGVVLSGVVGAATGLTSLVGVNLCQMDHKIEGNKHSYYLSCGMSKPAQPQKRSL
jgi:hypothetical protein